MRVLHHYLVAGCGSLAAMLTMGCGGSVLATGPSEQLGAIDIRVSTSGDVGHHDPDGYLVRIQDGPDWRIGLNETRSFGPFRKGPYQVLLTDLARGCSVDGDNPRWVDVIGSNAASSLAFTVRCLAGNDSGEGYWDY